MKYWYSNDANAGKSLLRDGRLTRPEPRRGRTYGAPLFSGGTSGWVRAGLAGFGTGMVTDGSDSSFDRIVR